MPLFCTTALGNHNGELQIAIWKHHQNFIPIASLNFPFITHKTSLNLYLLKVTATYWFKIAGVSRYTS